MRRTYPTGLCTTPISSWRWRRSHVSFRLSFASSSDPRRSANRALKSSYRLVRRSRSAAHVICPIGGFTPCRTDEPARVSMRRGGADSANHRAGGAWAFPISMRPSRASRVWVRSRSLVTRECNSSTTVQPPIDQPPSAGATFRRSWPDDQSHGLRHALGRARAEGYAFERRSKCCITSRISCGAQKRGMPYPSVRRQPKLQRGSIASWSCFGTAAQCLRDARLQCSEKAHIRGNHA